MTTGPVAKDVGLQILEKTLRSKRGKRFRKLPRVMARHDISMVWIFRGANVSLTPGDVLITLGEENLQPTSFLRVLCGLLPPDAGTVKVSDRSLLANQPKPKTLLNLSVGQSVKMLAGLYGMTDEETAERFDAICQMALVTKILHEPIDDQRPWLRAQLAFATAMHAPVDVLGLDGIAIVGEPKFREQCLPRLRAARDDGRILLIATRDPTLVRALGTKAILLGEDESVELSVSDAATYLEESSKSRKKGRRRLRQLMLDNEDDDDMPRDL